MINCGLIWLWCAVRCLYLSTYLSSSLIFVQNNHRRIRDLLWLLLWVIPELRRIIMNTLCVGMCMCLCVLCPVCKTMRWTYKRHACRAARTVCHNTEETIVTVRHTTTVSPRFDNQPIINGRRLFKCVKFAARFPYRTQCRNRLGNRCAFLCRTKWSVCMVVYLSLQLKLNVRNVCAFRMVV